MKFTRNDQGALTILQIEGVLDAVTAPDIRPAVDAIVTEKRPHVEVDLSSLRLIDSSGVGVLVSLYKRCREFGGSVRVVGAKDQPLAILKLLRLERVLGA